ncbi:MAG: ComEC/Rec2 family competence protein, partial [Comamonas sp.]
MRLSPTFWALAAAAGVALQLLQPALWQGWHYGSLGGVATLCGVIALRARQRARTPWARHGLTAAVVAAVAVAVAVAAFALTGWQALGRQAQRIAPALEGVDLQVVAVVDAMPTRSAQGLRMRLAVEQARQADGQSVALPDRLEVTWYTPRAAEAGPGASTLPAVSAGERWRWTLRLKAPHGARNPHGWDWELWLWAQGMGATGYVRDGANHAVPERLNAAEGRRPVEALRQQVRDAIVAQGAGPGTVKGEADAANDRRRAFGVVAALVTGDQRSIDTADWEVFRRTGVAHLVSISGLHITMFAWLAMRLLGALWRCSTRLCRWWPAPLAALWGGVV